MARKKAVTQASTETLEPRVYELGFLLSPAVREEDLDSRVDEIKSIITSAGGTFIAEGNPEFIDIAYEMVKTIDNKRVRFNQGYFGWLKFNLTPDQTKTVLNAVEKHLLVIRALLTLTVAENTIISKKPLSKILKSNTRSESTDESELIDDEVLDSEEVDPGIAAVELQTPINDDNDEMVESLTDTTETE
jgi:ribosomal protein S6